MSIKDICHQLSSDSNESIIQALNELSKRSRSATDVSELLDCVGFTQLHNLLKNTDRRFTLPVLSIFANCTNVCEIWRNKFRDGGGIQMIGETLQISSDPCILSRCARLIANLAKDSTSLHALQDKFIINALVNNGSLEDIKCQMSCLRAIRIICASKKCAKMAADCDKFPKLLCLLNSPAHEVMLLCLRMICQLLKTRAPEVCYRIVECETLSKILEFSKHAQDDVQSITYEILFLLALNSGCRVTVAMEGALEIFVDRIKTTDQSESFKFAVQSICLCAREAVSRNKMKNAGALPCLVRILNDDSLVYFHESIVAAFVLFIFDDLSLGILVTAGVIPAILKYLDRLTDIEFCRNQERMKSEFVELENTPNLPNVTEVDSTTETLLPEVIPEIPFHLPAKNEDISGYEKYQQCWSNSSPETSPYYAGSPPYIIPHVPPCYSPPHSPYSNASPTPYVSYSYSPPHSPYTNSPQLPYSPPHSPYYTSSPQRSNRSSSSQVSPCYSPQHSSSSQASPCYSPQHSPQAIHVIEDDVYSDPLNDSTCSSKQVPYQYQSADGMYAMIHGTRGPIHDTLLLLSRFSQATDPSCFFLFLPGFNHLLNYLLLSYNPKPKCARILNRLTQNSHCFDIMLKEKLMPRLYLRLCTGWSLEHLVKLFDDAKSRLKLTQEGEAGESDHHADSPTEDNLYKWKAPSETTLCLGRLLVSNIRSQSDSSYGKGVLSHILLTGSKLLKEKVVVSLPHIIRSMRLKKRVFWELKAAHLLLDMISSFPDIDSEMFVLNVEAICALSHLVGMSCDKLSDVQRIACIHVDDVKGCESKIEHASKRIKLDDTVHEEDSKVVFFKLPSGKIIPCDSKYLTNQSRVFERMLSHTYIDSTKTFIQISDINENAFVKLIHFMCGCQVRLDVYSHCEGVCLHNLKYKNTSAEGKSHNHSTSKSQNVNKRTYQSHVKHFELSVKDQSINHVSVEGVIQANNEVDKISCDDKLTECSSQNEMLPETPTPITIDQGDAEALQIIDTQNISMELEDSWIFGIQLLGCSERFFVDELKSRCENLLMSITSEENVVDLFFLSLLHNSTLLKKFTFNYLLTSINSPMVRTKCFAEILYSNEKNAFLEYLLSELVHHLHRQDK